MKLIGRRSGAIVVLLGVTAAATVVAAHATLSGTRARPPATGARLLAAPSVRAKVFRGDVRDLPQVATKLTSKPEFNADEPFSTKQPGG